MKKLVAIFILVIFSILIFNGIKQKADSNHLTELMLNNIECLATPENLNIFCFGCGSVDCPKDERLVLYYSR
ncbi:MAG: NVEALA domain-containing protein [Bacilli bacterium]|nr:NVEALA domain-containing protein [Bacilli bacterium]